MYALLKKAALSSAKFDNDYDKDRAIAEVLQVTEKDYENFCMLCNHVRLWINTADVFNIKKFRPEAIKLFQRLLGLNDTHTGKKIYYVNKLQRLKNTDAKITVGSKINRITRRQGWLQWSLGKPIHYGAGYVLEASLPKKQNVLLAPVKKQMLSRTITMLRVSSGHYKSMPDLIELLKVLRSYSIEQELITIGLDKTPCTVVKYIKPKKEK